MKRTEVWNTKLTTITLRTQGKEIKVESRCVRCGSFVYLVLHWHFKQLRFLILPGNTARRVS